MQHLDLDASHEGDTGYEYSDLDAAFDVLKARVFFPCLTTFYVHKLRAKYLDFISYLGAHKATLKSYGLDGCTFFDTDTELTDEAFEKQIINDLKEAGLPQPETCWGAANDDVE